METQSNCQMSDCEKSDTATSLEMNEELNERAKETGEKR